MKKKKTRNKRPTVYYLLLGVTLVLVLFGIVMITSSSSSLALFQQRDSFYYLKRQLVSAAAGFLAMFALSLMDYRKLKRISPVILFLSITLLLLVIVNGRIVYGSSRWFNIFGLTFQPSELSKLAVVIFTAGVLSREKKLTKDIRKYFLPLGIPLMIVAALVMVQPDMGTTFAIASTVFFMLYLAGARLRDMALLGSLGLAVSMIFIMTADYRRKRFFSFLDPWNDIKNGGFQIVQSLLALGSGGIGGVGLGFSRQKFGYLPTPFTDFIFAVIGEELGLIGSGAVILLFVIFGFLGLKIAQTAKDRFGQLLAGGITAMILIQAIINLGAVTGILPITGIPLPMVSFGGSSLITTLISIGILLNIASTGRRRSAGRVGVEGGNMRRGNSGSRLPRTSAGQGA